MAKDERSERGILGDINPAPDTRSSGEKAARERHEDEESRPGGSEEPDRPEHVGSRDVTEGVTGGAGTQVGGTRNYRQGSGAMGSDIGQRPE
jgi:hypothetical protein